MKLETAIKILEHDVLNTEGDLGPRLEAAERLGIEALKKWKLLREGRGGVIDPLLPGETEE